MTHRPLPVAVVAAVKNARLGFLVLSVNSYRQSLDILGPLFQSLIESATLQNMYIPDCQ